MNTLKQLMVVALVALAAGHAHATHPTQQQNPSFFVLAEHRFDPAIQRFMAERSLKSLPLASGQIYYVYPSNIDPQLEEIQIRYLEQLIDKNKKVEPKTE
jgi:hypothetical protein